MKHNPKIILKNERTIPQLGFGTWKLKGELGYESVLKALEEGHRHIDTALIYQNHEEVGRAIRDSKIPREELFITSKVWRDDLSKEGIIKQTQKCLEELDLEYLDLILIHWPNSEFDMKEAMEGLEEVERRGLVQSIGVSNFTIKHLKEALKHTDKIVVNQVEFHPYLYQKELQDFCDEHNIVLEAYSPLGAGGLLEEEPVLELAKKRKISPAQLLLSWGMEKGVVVLSRSSSKEHIEENCQVCEFELEEEEVKELDSLNKNKRFIHPDIAEFDK